MDFLERRVRTLEDDNQELRQEATKLACDTQICEERETELVKDVIRQLSKISSFIIIIWLTLKY